MYGNDGSTWPQGEMVVSNLPKKAGEIRLLHGSIEYNDCSTGSLQVIGVLNSMPCLQTIEIVAHRTVNQRPCRRAMEALSTKLF